MRKLVFLFLLGYFSMEVLTAQSIAKPDVSKIVLVVHGGAGTITRQNMTPEKEKAYTEVLQQALQAGYTILKKEVPVWMRLKHLYV